MLVFTTRQINLILLQLYQEQVLYVKGKKVPKKSLYQCSILSKFGFMCFTIVALLLCTVVGQLTLSDVALKP